jgi:hypothetical protein
MSHYRQAVHTLTELALQTDKGHCAGQHPCRKPAAAEHHPARHECHRARKRRGHHPCQPAHLRGIDRFLVTVHRQRLDELLKRKDGSKMTWLAWLRQSPVKPNSRHMLEHIERLKAWQALDLPAGIERQVHQNRLLKIAREGGQMTPADLAKFESQRRYATSGSAGHRRHGHRHR